MAGAELMWLIEHPDGLRRSWLGASTPHQAEDARLACESTWDEENRINGWAKRTEPVTKTSFPPEQYDDRALEVHRRVERELGSGIEPFIVDRAV